MGKITNYDDNDFLGKISQNISDVCLKIKNFTNGKMSLTLYNVFLCYD